MTLKKFKLNSFYFINFICCLMLCLILIVYTLKFQRVKVYRLNDDGKWDDQGTGHVTVDYLEVCD